VEGVEIVKKKFVDYGCSIYFEKGPHSSLWAGLRAARVEITIVGIPNILNYCA
jgi:hypothetical protein